MKAGGKSANADKREFEETANVNVHMDLN